MNSNTLLQEVIKHLYRSTWIDIMDLIVVYSRNLDERIKRGWSAKCKTCEDDHSYLEYVSLDGEKYYYGKDIEYARIDSADDYIKIELLHKFNRDQYELDEFYSEEKKDFLIRDKKEDPFMRGKVFQINEDFVDFDLSIVKDINKNQIEYESNIERLLNLKENSDQCIGIKRKRNSNDDKELLDIFSDTNIRFLSLQGPPGTGKTTFIADLIDKLLQKGIPPEQITCISHTKRAVEEIFRKLTEKTEDNNANLRKEYLPKEANESIIDCARKIYVGTIFKNGNKARECKREYIIIDEASQIQLPLLLYGLRYGKEGCVLRFFGDQEQLAPTQSYIRDLGILPAGNFSEISRKYLQINDKGQEYLENAKRYLNEDFIYPKYSKDDQLVLKEFLKKIEIDQLNSIWGQSIFSLPGYINENKELKGLFASLAQYLINANFTKNKNYRQEEVLHDKTKRIFYPGIPDYECNFPQAETNIIEAERIAKTYSSDNIKSQRLIAHLCHDVRHAFGIFKTVAKKIIRRFIVKDPHFKDILVWDKRIIPFQDKRDEDIKEMINKYSKIDCSQQLLNELIKKINLDLFMNKLLPALRKHLVILRHTFEQSGSMNRNDFEIWLTGLLLYLWEHEDFRVQYGFGVVTPYRIQEVELYRYYKRCYPQSKLFDKEWYKSWCETPKGWCATPERFQGRDMSRIIVSLVNSKNDIFLEPNSMFTRNKINVATSRAGSQLIIIGHETLLSAQGFNNYMKQVNNLPDVERRIVEKYAKQYREKLKQFVELCKNDSNCALVDII